MKNRFKMSNETKGRKEEGQLDVNWLSIRPSLKNWWVIQLVLKETPISCTNSKRCENLEVSNICRSQIAHPY